ncbi:alpha-galactosidase [Kiloniella majae]|uniref:alpha-galactosidase n=1 Tax=Kiloniella majae TaxID=1938558 RepID=UPI000A277DB0|nr:alpha-galactosidase [Kiloniella majae]
MSIWSLQDQRQSLVFCSKDDRLPEIIYWGPRLPDQENLETLSLSHQMDVTGGMVDENTELSICPEEARAFPGQAGLSIRNNQGIVLRPLFKFIKAEKTDNALFFIYQDHNLELTYKAHFCLSPSTGMIKARAEISSIHSITIDYLSAPVFPASQTSQEIIDFSGRWIGEFQLNKTPWSSGIRLRENRTGRTGHEHFPALLVPSSGSTNSQGDVFGFHYAWSGGHRMIAEEFPDGRRQIQFSHARNSIIEPVHEFSSAPLYAMYSSEGFNGCAIGFQRHLREEIVKFPDRARPRPVHYNCWEAVYFDHKIPELTEIANRAAKLGAERFVLDDGWFDKRDDDTSSLGDWDIDPRKYPDGLNPLINHIHDLGMTFGLWFEPEMINHESVLYRDHPEWILGPADQPSGRHQFVLNLGLKDVRNYLFQKITNLLSQYDIDYVKWDHNRVLPFPDASQTEGFYSLLDELRKIHPTVEFESCASGGGRIDYAVLERTSRVWLSDSNDALERLRIQHNAALFLPSVVTGSHVGPRNCHTSGRNINIVMRAWVAAQRHMGFEMDPRELTDQEANVLSRITQWWKDNRLWLTKADILRLDSSDPSVIAEEQLAEDGARFIVFAGKADSSQQILPRPLKLTRLDPSAIYQIKIINQEDTIELSRGTPVLKSKPLELSGQALMSHGLNLPWSFPLSMWVIEGKRI